MTDASEPSVRSPRERFVHELPWIAGVLVGAVLLVVLTDAFRPVSSPMGADWWEYRLCAHVLRHPEYSHYYPPWRPTLHPTLLGLLGDRWGYAWADTMVSSVSSVLLIVGTTVAVRAISGPWAAAVAALAAAMLPLHVAGVHWTNPSPFMGGLCAIAVAASLAAFRWPRWPVVLAAGLLTGLGWAADSRGVVLVPLALGLVAFAPRGGLRESWKRRALLLALVAMAMVPGRMVERALAVKDASSSVDMVDAAVDPSKIVPPMYAEGDHHAGRGEPPPPPPASLEEVPAWKRVLATASAPETVERIEGQITEARGLPPFFLMWIPLMALLPGRHGWRGALASLAVLVYTLIQVIVPAWLTDFGPRYTYFFLATIVVLVVVAPFRLMQTVGGRLPSGIRVCVASSLALALALGLWGRRPPAEYQLFDEDRAVRELARYFEGRLRSGEQWLECGVLGAETHWYPTLLHEGDLNPYGADWEMCQPYVLSSTPVGQRRWLVSTDRLTNATPEAPGPPFSSSIPNPRDHGWRELHRFQVSPEMPNVIVWEQAP